MKFNMEYLNPLLNGAAVVMNPGRNRTYPLAASNALISRFTFQISTSLSPLSSSSLPLQVAILCESSSFTCFSSIKIFFFFSLLFLFI